MELHQLIYFHDDSAERLGLVAKVGTKYSHVIVAAPTVRVVKLNGTTRWRPVPAESLHKTSLRPGACYRRHGKRFGITKQAKRLLQGIK